METETSLPIELWLSILEELSVSDIKNLIYVCKEWSLLFSQNKVWDQVFRKYFRRHPGLDPKRDFAKHFEVQKNWQNGKFCMRRRMLGDSSVNVVEYAPNGQCAVAADDDGKLWFLETSSSSSTRILGTHSSLIWVAHFLEGGRQVVSSGHDNKIKLWNLDPNLPNPLLREIPNDHLGGIWEIRSHNGKFYTTGNDGMLRCIEVETGQEIHKWQVSRSFVWNLLPLWSRDLLVASSQDSNMHFFDYRMGKCISRIQAEEQLTQIKNPDPSWPDLLLGGNTQGTVNLWDIRSVTSRTVPAALPPAATLLFPSSVRDIAVEGRQCVVIGKEHKMGVFGMKQLVAGEGMGASFGWDIGEVDGYCLGMNDMGLLVGTRKGEVVECYFGKPQVGFWEGIVSEGIKTVEDGCSIM